MIAEHHTGSGKTGETSTTRMIGIDRASRNSSTQISSSSPTIESSDDTLTGFARQTRYKIQQALATCGCIVVIA
jgi:hypothetical protein